MKSVKIFFLAGVLAVLVIPAAAWAYRLDSIGKAGGWDDINRSTSATAVIDTSDLTVDLPGANTAAALNNAFSTWDNVAGAKNLNFQFQPDLGGDYDVFDGPADSNGPPWFNGFTSTLDPNAHWRYANIVIGGWLPSSYFGDDNILAETWMAQLTGDGSRKKTWHTEVFFNEAWNWTDDAAAAQADFEAGLAGRVLDVQTIALHEIGHTIGLGHEDYVPSVMATYYDGVQRILYADDVAGVTALYSNNIGGGKNPHSPPGHDEWYLAGVTYAGFAIPEPATLALLALSVAALLRLKGRRL